MPIYCTCEEWKRLHYRSAWGPLEYAGGGVYGDYRDYVFGDEE